MGDGMIWKGRVAPPWWIQHNIFGGRKYVEIKGCKKGHQEKTGQIRQRKERGQKTEKSGEGI